MPIPERRKILQNGIEAEQFQNMDESTQNWHLYSQVQLLAGYVGGFIEKEFEPIKSDVGTLKKFKRNLLVGIGITGAFLCGLGIIEYKTVAKYLIKLVT